MRSGSDGVVGDDRARRGRVAVDWLLAVVLPAVVVALIFLTPFIRDPSQTPFGNDSSAYMARTDLVFEAGIERLSPDAARQIYLAGNRPAHPILLAILRSLVQVDSLEIMRILPAILAGAIALGCSGLAADGARQRRNLSGIVGIGVGASVYVAYTAAGYSSNLAFDVVAVGAATLAARVAVAARPRETVGAALLLAGGAMFHWIFAAILAGILVAMAVLLLIAGRWAGGPDGRPLRGASARILRALGIGLGLTAALFLWFAPSMPDRLPFIGRTVHLMARSSVRLPLMLAFVPLSVGGAAAIAVGRRGRWILTLLLPWAMLAVVGVIGLYEFHLPSPPYRWAGFALGIPLLTLIGSLTVPEIVPTLAGRVAGVALAVVAAAALVASGASVWWNLDSGYQGTRFAELRTVSRYADQLPPDTSIVLPVRSGTKYGPIIAGLGPTVFSRVIVVQGGLRADRRLVHPAPAVTLYVSSLNLRPPPETGTPLGDGVVVVEGPALAVTPAPVPLAPGPPGLIGQTAACLAALVVAGIGWSLAFTDLSVIGAVSLAPAFGMASLGIIGLVCSRAGVPLHGAGAVAIFLATAATGGVLAVAAKARPNSSVADSIGS